MIKQLVFSPACALLATLGSTTFLDSRGVAQNCGFAAKISQTVENDREKDDPLARARCNPSFRELLVRSDLLRT